MAANHGTHIKNQHTEGDRAYERETSSLSRWFKTTYIAEGENQMNDEDREKLKSLGYIQ